MKKNLLTIALVVFLLIGYVLVGKRSDPPNEQLGEVTNPKAIDYIAPLTINGEQITFPYTDDNTGENIIIATDDPFVKGNTMHIAIKNISGKDQNVKYQVSVDGTAETKVLEEFVLNAPYQVRVPDYGDLSTNCKNGWEAVPSDGVLENFYKCGNEMRQCNSVVGNTCNQTNVETGAHFETRYKDQWVSIVEKPIENLKSLNVKEVPEKFVAKDQYSLLIKDGETKYLRATFDIKAQTSGQFYINAYGDQGGIGHLDPWYDSTYLKCKKITLIPNGATGGIATTSTAGFVLLATTTDNDFRGTSSAGFIEELSSDNKRPLDMVWTNGTDCNSDGGSLIPFFHESYSSTTGQVVTHFKHSDISSTTNKYALVYFGKDGGTDQSNETGVFDATYKGAWNFNEYPLTVLDSTSNNADAGNVRNFTSVTTGQINGAGDGPGSTGSYISLSTNPMDALTRFTLDTWVFNDVTTAGLAFWSDWTSRQLLWRNEGGNNFRLLVEWTASTLDTGPYTPSGYAQSKWTKLTITYDGTTLRTYSNSVAGATVADSGKTVKTHTGANTMNIGGGPTGSEADWNGRLDHFRMRNIAEHYTDIRTHYNNEVCNVCTLTFGTTESQTAGGGGGNVEDFWDDY